MATEEQNLSVLAKASKTFATAADSFKAGMAAREEGESSETGKAVAEALKGNLNTSFLAPLKSLKSSLKSMPGAKIVKGMAKDIMKQGRLSEMSGNDNKAAAQEEKDETTRQNKRQFKSIFTIGVMVKAILGTLNKMLKALMEGAGKGLGALAGLLFAPLAFLSGLLSGLLISIKKLAKLVPIKTIGKAFGLLGRILRAVAKIQTFGLSEKLIRGVQKAMTSMGSVFKRIGSAFGKGASKLGGSGSNLMSGIGKYFGKGGGFFKMIRGVMGLGVDGKPVVTTPKWAKNALKMWKSIKSVFNSFGKTIGTTVKAVKGFMTPLVKGFKAIFGPIKLFAKTLGLILGKLLYPITLVIALWDTVSGAIDGWTKTEGSLGDKLIGGLKGGITGLLNSLIGMPLDLLKAGVAWLLKKMGFDESSAALKKFSFTKLISDMVSGFFGFVQTAIDWIKTVIADPKAALAALWLKIVGEGGLIDILWAPIKGAYEWVKTVFTDPLTALKALWTGLTGKGGLLDLFWMPIDLVIDWVTKKFGWRDDAAPKFNLLTIITDVVGKVWSWIRNTFSWDKIKGALTSWVPGMGSKKEEAPPLTGKEKEEFDAQALEASKKDKVLRAKVANSKIKMRNQYVLGRQGKINIENARERLAAAQKEQGIDKAKGRFYGRSDDDKTAEKRAEEQVLIEKARAHLKSLENKQSAVQEAMKINNSIIQKGGDSTTVVVQQIKSPNANAQKNSR